MAADHWRNESIPSIQSSRFSKLAIVIGRCSGPSCRGSLHAGRTRCCSLGDESGVAGIVRWVENQRRETCPRFDVYRATTVTHTGYNEIICVRYPRACGHGSSQTWRVVAADPLIDALKISCCSNGARLPFAA